MSGFLQQKQIPTWNNLKCVHGHADKKVHRSEKWSQFRGFFKMFLLLASRRQLILLFYGWNINTNKVILLYKGFLQSAEDNEANEENRTPEDPRELTMTLPGSCEYKKSYLKYLCQNLNESVVLKRDFI